jgi:hypothetical protein
VSEHLSSLSLDEVAAGLSTGAPHLATCAECRARVAERQAFAAQFVARPRAKQQLAAFAPPRPREHWLRVVVAVAVPLAAAIALVVLSPRGGVVEPEPQTRLKGAPSVTLRDASGNAVTRASPGQQLTLSVGAPGFSRVTVTARTHDGKAETLFSGGIEGDTRVDLLQL